MNFPSTFKMDHIFFFFTRQLALLSSVSPPCGESRYTMMFNRTKTKQTRILTVIIYIYIYICLQLVAAGSRSSWMQKQPQVAALPILFKEGSWSTMECSG